MTNKIKGFFEEYVGRESVFINKKVLQSSYIPAEISHRDDQINTIANILAPTLKGDRPSNLFVYGKTGTGKTLVVKHTTEQLNQVAKKNNIDMKVIYLNCKLKKVADTEYRLIAQLARFFGKTIPTTGLPTDEVYNIFFEAIEESKQKIIFILDEIDQLVKKAGDGILYNLTRINPELKHSEIAIIGISNDLIFSNNLDPRVKSSLSEEEIVFPPYNALQIQSILKKRCELAFKNKGIGEGVIAKCAAFAAREHGDARRALELLRVAGELADREEDKRVELKHLDLAEDKIEHDRVFDIVKNQPKQFQLTLYAILQINEHLKKPFYTGETYELYKELSEKVGLRPLTQRRVSDIIAELDMLGIINAKVISKGRFGRTKEISIALSKGINDKVKEILTEELGA